MLICRKILVHVAVEEVAEKGLTFKQYVEYLADSNVVPAKVRPWVDHIRSVGNDANHEIVVFDAAAATELLYFVEQLLRIVYEIPSRLPPITES